MKKILATVMVLMLAFGLVGCGGDSAKESINVYNAGEYIDPQTLEMFEEETGIKVVYDTFSSNEDLYVKLSQGTDQFDVVVPSDYMIERLKNEDRLEKIDTSKLTNYGLIESTYKNMSYDPENAYSVPYFAGTLGIVYNPSIVGEVDSWNALWDPKNEGQIIMYDSQRDSIAVTLAKLGYSLNETDPEILAQVEQELIKQKPLVQAYLTDSARDAVIGGEAGMAVMYSGDAALMIAENPDLKYVIPKEGSNVFVDAMVIPKGTEKMEAALKFIDFMSRPEISAINAEYLVGYTSPVQGVQELLPDELASNPVAYPDYSKLPKLEAYKDLGDAVTLYDKVWTEVSATQN
ncbi:ABC transporter substrate-binding protein [Peptoniphilus equinus]|uniref:ABC transporter substrate-binding protein n=1 Tax=Peptoniphilus equinus TaxID=3016343 RepID=A0ABY7QTW4_9FIRM|nr:ABC transporter substrate-binding protein [Peptoniphilus equinus]WBW49725.1 ABC transporter substrate-binding protein [Peptoniphilus equinus]